MSGGTVVIRLPMAAAEALSDANKIVPICAKLEYVSKWGEYMENDTLLVSTREAARLLGVGVSTLRLWQCDGHGPRPIHVGRPDAKRRTLRYRLADIRSWAGGGDE